MRRLIWFLVILLVVLAAIPVGLVIASIEEAPAVSNGHTPDSADAARAKALIARFKRAVEGAQGATVLRARQDEIESLLAFIGRGVPRLATRATITPERVGLAATVRLPENPLGRYANLRASVTPSPSGLVIDEVAVGRLRIPGEAVTAGLRLALDAAFGAADGAAVLDAIEAVAVEGTTVALRVRPDRALAERLAGRVREAIAVAEPKRVRAYVALIDRLRPSGGSLAGIIAPVFALAAERSASGDAVTENRAALMALAMTFGDARFERMVGEVRIGALANASGGHGASLAGRGDLVQHVVVSAGLALVANLGVADAIGEFKEIKDTLAGGSGFSFSDIAADRLGVRLAEAAVADPASARRLQRRLAQVSGEEDFFPSIAGLPDNLSEADFRARFGDVDSPAYRALIADIDRRIAALPIFAEG